MDNIVGRQINLSQSQEEIINGCLLGDGRLECRSKKSNARLRVHHGIKQKNLIFWKYKIFKELVSCPPRKIICGRDIERDKEHYSWYFHTVTMSKLGSFYNRFYKNKIKKLPKQIFEIVTPLSLAVWIMDDGCFDRNSIILNTQNFSLSENKILKEMFDKKFGFCSSINKDRNKWRLRFRKADFKKVRKLVKPYVIPSMRYKIVPVTTSSLVKEGMVGT